MNFTQANQEYIVGQFNAVMKAANKRVSKQMNAIFTDMCSRATAIRPDATSDEIIAILIKMAESEGTKKIVDAYDGSRFGKELAALNEDHEEKEPKKEEKKEPKKMETKESALGTLERAIHDSVVDVATGEVVEEVKPIIDAFIKKTYGKVVHTIEYEFPKHETKGSGVFHEEFETVLAFAEADEPVLLVGPAGTGKNHLCKQVAEAMNLPFYFSNAVTQEYKLTGFTDANGTFHESQFYKAFTQGGLFTLDEMDASIPEVLIILNAAIANRYFDFPAPIGKKEAHPDFRVIAGANTFGTGADSTYSGRYQLDGASLDRFAVVEIDYSEVIENSMTNDQELLEFLRAFRKDVNDNGISCIVSYRSISRMDKMSHALSLEKTIKTCLTKGLEREDLNMIHDLPFPNKWTSAFKKLQGKA